MTEVVRTTKKQDLLASAKNCRGTMPAKSISWRWNAPTEREATQAVISYYGKQVGTMTVQPNGEINGAITLWVNDGSGSNVWVEASTHDGYPDFKSCGNQLFYKFKRAAEAAGFHWPW